jgi:hypothetical protein
LTFFIGGGGLEFFGKKEEKINGEITLPFVTARVPRVGTT